MTGSDETPDETVAERPVLRVVRGEPTAEELAVLTALASAAGDAGDEPAAPTRGRWNDPAWTHQRPIRSGPGGWRSAAR